MECILSFFLGAEDSPIPMTPAETREKSRFCKLAEELEEVSFAFISDAFGTNNNIVSEASNKDSLGFCSISSNSIFIEETIPLLICRDVAA